MCSGVHQYLTTLRMFTSHNIILLVSLRSYDAHCSFTQLHTRLTQETFNNSLISAKRSFHKCCSLIISHNNPHGYADG